MTKHSELRIKTNPNNPSIIAGSTPVLFFGNINNSKVATLGINPSKNEFLENGIELSEEEKRFETLNSLEATNHENLTNEHIEKVINSCLNYYNINPYRRWFDVLENYILKKLSVSYYSGSACHLDIVQWATDPIWRDLDDITKVQLIKRDIEFLSIQLQVEKIDTLLINGKGATEIFLEYFKPTLIKQDRLLVANKSCNVYSYELKLKNKIIKIYAWSNNLQSTVGLTNQMRAEIGNWVEEQANQGTLEEPKDIKIDYTIKNEKKGVPKISKKMKGSKVMAISKYQEKEVKTTIKKNTIEEHFETSYFKIAKNWYGQRMVITVRFKNGRIYQYNHDEVYENTIWYYENLPCWEKDGYFSNSSNIPKTCKPFVTEII